MRKIGLFLIALALLALPLVGAAQDDGAELRQWANDAEASSEFGSDSWSAMQATGAPNVAECGDNALAWASGSPTEEATLTVFFEVPVLATEVNIHQSFNPGAVVEVELLYDGDEVESFEVEADPDDDCPAVISVDVSGVDTLIDGVAITVDQSITENWSEIDAVELVGLVEPGTELEVWASEAEASSEFGEDLWSAAQATGPASVEQCADDPAAWASATPTEEAELTVYFPVPLVPATIEIYQSYNPGAITQVDFITDDGDLITIEDSADPGTDCPGVLAIDVDAEGTVVVGAVIYLDQSITGNWNEIDAVRLIGTTAGSSDSDSDSGDIEIEDELDYGDSLEGELEDEFLVYSFEGEEGDEITISLVSDDFDPLVYLVSADGEELTSDDDSGGDLDSLIEDFELPDDGTYYIIVTSFSGDGEGEFELSLDD